MDHDPWRIDETLSAPALRRRLARQTCVGLTLLWHPDRSRIGAQAALIVKPGEVFPLNRLAPIFFDPAARTSTTAGQPLMDRSVSRTPIGLTLNRDGGVLLEVPDSRMLVRNNGLIAAGQVMFDSEDLKRGVVLELGDQVVLCLGLIAALPEPGPDLGLIGIGPAIQSIRAQIRQISRSELPVLILGESGTGKELIARALHEHSARRSHALVSVNMAALSEQLAAADLFGAIKGSYTGATQGRRGLFAEADGGTLFLDEIGDTPAVVQPMLLRALETGEYRPVGATRTERSSARILAATDRQLGGGSFNVPLLRRLEALVVNVPPLCERREDIGVLVRHLLQQEEAVEPSLFDARDLAALALFDWPGNVRQLAHVVRRLLLARRSKAPMSVASILEGLVAPASSSTARSAPPAVTAEKPKSKPYRDPGSVDDESLCAALAQHQWCVRDAAEHLGVSRTSFYALLDKSRLVRQPQHIPAEELKQVMRDFPDQLDRWADVLKTPKESLKRFVRQRSE